MSFVTKETVVTIKDSNGDAITVGDYVMVESGGKCYIGEFMGFGSRGSLKFHSIISENIFNLSPKAIKAMKYTKLV